MEITHVVILAIIEGITEFLPISSTGHLVLASHLLGIAQTEANKSFEIIIQLGAIMAVVVLYAKRLLTNRKLLKLTLIAFIPTGIIGFIFYRLVKTYLLGNIYVTLGSLFIGGVIIILMERRLKGNKGIEIDDMSYKQALGVGLVQSVSIIPGVSRAASTIIGGIFLGLSRSAAVELSFLLAIPTMAAATGLDLLKSYKEISSSDITNLTVGFIISFAVALVAIRFLLDYIKKYDFVPFGIYRIILAFLFFFLLA